MLRLLARIKGWWDGLRDSLWLMPATGVVLATILAGWLVALEPMPEWMPTILAFGGGPGSARAVLSALAGSTFTVIGLVFSLTVIALQMSSSQFTPRVLRSFLKDRSVQSVLTGLVASGVFHVAVLRVIRAPDEGQPFVPELAVTVALLLALVAVGLLVFFLHHLTSRLRVDVVMASIRRETQRHLHAMPDDGGGTKDQVPPDPPADAIVVVSRLAGYVRTIELEALVTAAVRHEGVILLRPMLGAWVTQGSTLAWVWPEEHHTGSLDADALSSAVHRGVHLGPDRTESGDPAFGLRQLEDIAARALSPGMNDPTTAVQAIGQLAAILTTMTEHPMGTDTGCDEHGVRRVTVPRATFPSCLELAVGQVRRYGADEPAVLIAILELLTDVGERVTVSPGRRSAVQDQIERTERVGANLADPVDRARVQRAVEVARSALTHGHRTSAQAETG